MEYMEYRIVVGMLGVPRGLHINLVVLGMCGTPNGTDSMSVNHQSLSGIYGVCEYTAAFSIYFIRPDNYVGLKVTGCKRSRRITMVTSVRWVEGNRLINNAILIQKFDQSTYIMIPVSFYSRSNVLMCLIAACHCIISLFIFHVLIIYCFFWSSCINQIQALYVGIVMFIWHANRTNLNSNKMQMNNENTKHATIMQRTCKRTSGTRANITMTTKRCVRKLLLLFKQMAEFISIFFVNLE